ncbi:MAG: hypothetical protein ABEJ99_03990 [Candidatus Nanohaloarchaea archaeon]
MKEGDREPEIFGVSTGDEQQLRDIGISLPPLLGAIAGPAGGLIKSASLKGVTRLGYWLRLTHTFQTRRQRRSL